jgi:hypothetical protein
MSNNVMTLLQKATAVLGYAYGGEHHIPAKIYDQKHFVEINVPVGIATFDFDQLTRLVMGCHYYCVRMEIAQSSPRRVKLYFHDRKREGGVMDRHPGIDELFENVKEDFR